MKLKARLQFLGTVPLLTGADRMQDRPWTLCFSVLFFSIVSPHRSLCASSPSLSFTPPSSWFSCRPSPLSIVCNGARTTTLGSLLSCLLRVLRVRDKLFFFLTRVKQNSEFSSKFALANVVKNPIFECGRT